MLLFYDFEVFKYDWVVVIINQDNIETVIINDKDKLESFYTKHKDDIFIGYNSNKYDRYILKAILCGYNPKQVNDYIIKDKKSGHTFSKLFTNIKINSYDVMDGIAGRKSLKELEGHLGVEIVESEIDFNIERKLTEDEIKQTIQYCRTDVKRTKQIFELTSVELKSKMQLINMFKLPLSYVAKTQADLASSILASPVTTHFTDENDPIQLPKNLKIEKYTSVIDFFTQSDNVNRYSIDIAGIPHVFGLGGLHGAKKLNYTCKEDEVLVMADVSQLYPFLMLKYDLLSRNTHSDAKRILHDTITTSLELKAQGKKEEREPYKRFNNIIYGAMGAAFNKLYDPRNRELVCVYGQLLILDLIEKVENISKLIQTNTDGILILIKKNQIDNLRHVLSDWESRTQLMLTTDMYTTIYQGDVNNYVLISDDFDVKTKGSYVKYSHKLDNDLPVVSKAIREYLISKTPVKETIMHNCYFIDFQKIVKLSSKYDFAWHASEIKGNKALKGKVFRVFASTDMADGYIGKQKAGSATIEKFANTPEHCFIDNSSMYDGVKLSEPSHKLDYEWYIQLAEKRLLEKFNFGVLDEVL